MHYLLFSAQETYPTVSLSTALDNVNWVSGARMLSAPPLLEFELDAAEPFVWPDYLQPNSAIPLFSPALREAIASACAGSIEYYPASVTNVRTGQIRAYHAANVIGILPAMDRKKSDFTPARRHSIMVRFIDNLILDEAACAELDIFRLAEFDLLIVISETVARALLTSSLMGIRVLAPQEWDGLET